MRLERRYEAEAAHQLTAGLPKKHPCRRKHGHRYIVIVTIAGEPDAKSGMILEYADIDARVHQVLGHIDHRDLNDLGELKPIFEKKLAAAVAKNPTVELLARWFKAELKHLFPNDRPVAPYVFAVRIEEDSRSAVEV